MLKTIIIAMLSIIFLNGCVGYVSKTEDLKTICTNDCYFSNGYGGKFISKNKDGVILSSNIVTKQTVKDYWREPDSIINLGEYERWVYNDNVWEGYMPMFIIPIPLMLPTGEEYTEITFDNNGLAINVDQKMQVEKGMVCVPFKIVDTVDTCLNVREPLYPVFNK